MNKLEKTFIAGGVGTSVMTASSALMSLLPKEEFREPDQLAKLVGRLMPTLSNRAKIIAGWGAHYAMGLVFAAVYVELWEKRKIEHSIRNGIILGVLSGLLGILIWKATFSVHPLPPNNRKLDFYLQRIPAHLVFAVFATIAYRAIEEKGTGTIKKGRKINRPATTASNKTDARASTLLSYKQKKIMMNNNSKNKALQTDVGNSSQDAALQKGQVEADEREADLGNVSNTSNNKDGLPSQSDSSSSGADADRVDESDNLKEQQKGSDADTDHGGQPSV